MEHRLGVNTFAWTIFVFACKKHFARNVFMPKYSGFLRQHTYTQTIYTNNALTNCTITCTYESKKISCLGNNIDLNTYILFLFF